MSQHSVFTTTHKLVALGCVATVMVAPLFGDQITRLIDRNMPRTKDLYKNRRELLYEQMERAKVRKESWALFSGRPFNFGREKVWGSNNYYQLQKQSAITNSYEENLERNRLTEKELEEKNQK